MMASGVLPRSRSGSPSRAPTKRGLALGLSFDPYDYSLLPKRVIAVGSAANFPSVISVLADVFSCPVFVPLSDASVANAGHHARPATAASAAASVGAASTPGVGSSLTPTHTSTAQGATSTAITMSAAATQAAAAAHLPPGIVPAPSRASAAIGAAYLACWAYRRQTRPGDRYETFEEEIKTLLKASADAARVERKSQALAQGVYSLSLSGSGASTPLGRSSLGIPSPLMERDEDDSDDDNEDGRTQGTDDDHVLLPHQRQYGQVEKGIKASSSIRSIGSTSHSSMSTLASQSTAFPSTFGSSLTLNTVLSSSASRPYGLASPTPTVPLAGTSATPVTAQPATLSVSPLPSEDADIDVGLVKVADGDVDSFMTYASLVPEYCRLEGMLVRALV